MELNKFHFLQPYLFAKLLYIANSYCEKCTKAVCKNRFMKER